MTSHRLESFSALVTAGLQRGAIWALYVTSDEAQLLAAVYSWIHDDHHICLLVHLLARQRMSELAQQTDAAEPETWPSCSNYPEVFALDRAAGPSCFSRPQEPEA